MFLAYRFPGNINGLNCNRDCADFRVFGRLFPKHAGGISQRRRKLKPEYVRATQRETQIAVVRGKKRGEAVCRMQVNERRRLKISRRPLPKKRTKWICICYAIRFPMVGYQALIELCNRSVVML